jgi:hypothetical protein
MKTLGNLQCVCVGFDVKPLPGQWVKFRHQIRRRSIGE